MSKYAQLQLDVFSIFAQPSWAAENIKTFPSGVLVKDAAEYIRISVLPTGNPLNSKSASGLIIVEIFTAANIGPMRAFVIADKLDQFLLGKSIPTGTSVTQFSDKSSLSPRGIDPVNSNLIKSNFSISFNHFGAF